MHLIDMSNDRANISYTGEVPWHGLGFQVSPDATLVEWQKAAGLEWEVAKVGLTLATPLSGLDDYKLLVRQDTQNVLNVVKNRYVPVQPSTILSFFAEFQKQTGVRMETLGSLSGGRVIWGLARTGRDLTVDPKDRMAEYLLFASSFDYSLSSILQRTSVRVVCNNTLQMSLQGPGILIKRSHAGAFDVNYAIKLATHVMDDDQGAEAFKSRVLLLSQRRVTHEEVVEFFTSLFYPNTDNAKMLKSKHVQTRLADVINIFHNAPGQSLATAQDTAWGLVNAVTYFVDHIQGRTNDTRVKSAFFQQGKDLKTEAFYKALKLAA